MLSYYKCRRADFVNNCGLKTRYESDAELDDGTTKLLDSRAVFLNSLNMELGKKINYECDFGDGWHHEILVEKFLAPSIHLISHDYVFLKTK